MRLIDADELEKLFREVIGHIAKRPDINFNMEHMIRASAMVIEMINDAPTVTPEPHWIPVTERTPRKRDHKDDMVLVCNENGSIRFNTCINGTWVYGDPIAWMPLPEPYKGVTE